MGIHRRSLSRERDALAYVFIGLSWFFYVEYFRKVRAEVGRSVRRLIVIIQVRDGGWLGQKG